VTDTASQHYRNQELMTASPARLVVMLYDRAIQSLNEAIKAIADGDIQRRWKANKNASEIITHLAMTLNFEEGGQIALNLNDLYRFMLRTLVNVDVRNDPQPARDVIKLIEPLRESWDQLAKGVDSGQLPAYPKSQAAAGQASQAAAPADNPAPPPRPGVAISA
jgi:flagellar protein FliS